MQNGQFPPSRKQSGAREAGSARRREARGAGGGKARAGAHEMSVEISITGEPDEHRAPRPPSRTATGGATTPTGRAEFKSATTNCRAHYDDEAPTDHAKTRRRARSPQTPRRTCTARTRSLRELEALAARAAFATLMALAALAAFATLMRTRRRTANPQTQRREASAAATTRSSQDAPISPHPSPPTCLLQPAATLG